MLTLSDMQYFYYQSHQGEILSDKHLWRFSHIVNDVQAESKMSKTSTSLSVIISPKTSL